MEPVGLPAPPVPTGALPAGAEEEPPVGNGGLGLPDDGEPAPVPVV